MRQIWLVRHGNRLDFIQPEWFLSALHRYDPPLCPVGRQQAGETAQRLAVEQIDHVFSSPFLRTLETAGAIAAVLGRPIKVEPGLGEWLNPDWLAEMPTLTSGFPEHLPGIRKHIDLGYRGQIFPQYPEGRSPLIARVQTTLEILLQQFSGNLLLVGHKDPLLCCAQTLTGQTLKLNLDVCSVTLFQQDKQGDHWRCVLANDSSHLSNPGVKVAE